MILIPRHPQFTVTPDAMRPASPEHRCFYCWQPVGGIHGPECVMVRRRLVLTATVKPSEDEALLVDFPESLPWHWDSHQVLFRCNEGAWCANNLIRQLDRENPAIRTLMARLYRIAGRQGCLCNCTTVSVKEWGDEAFLEER